MGCDGSSHKKSWAFPDGYEGARVEGCVMGAGGGSFPVPVSALELDGVDSWLCGVWHVGVLVFGGAS